MTLLGSADRDPPSVDYRTNARPRLAAVLGRKPGPAVAVRRVVPGYMVSFAGVFAVLAGLASAMPDTTYQLVASTPLFSAMYTLSVLGLVGFVTLVFLRVTLFRAHGTHLHVTADELRLERPEGAITAPLQAVSRESIDLPLERAEKTGMVLRFPNGQRVRIVVGEAAERVEHDDPWDYTLEEEDFLELEKRMRGPLGA